MPVLFRLLGNTPCGLKGKGVVSLLAIRLCGFPTALFTKYSQPCHARLAFRGMCQLERDIKNAGSRWTARKVEECTLLGYSLLGGILLPKSLPVLLPTVYR